MYIHSTECLTVYPNKCQVSTVCSEILHWCFTVNIIIIQYFEQHLMGDNKILVHDTHKAAHAKFRFKNNQIACNRMLQQT